MLGIRRASRPLVPGVEAWVHDLERAETMSKKSASATENLGLANLGISRLQKAA
jgi:hypothetical protein